MQETVEHVTLQTSSNAGQSTPSSAHADSSAACPECNAAITMASDTVMGEILSCPDCGAELEVTGLAPLSLSLAPHEEEDWGE